MKVNIYIDGFNLYYGCLKNSPYRWLDLSKLCHVMLPSHEINRIRYFTARLDRRVYDPDQPQRQQLYLRALATIPNLSIHYGSFKTQRVRRHLVSPLPDGTTTVEVYDPKEKGSDVNLATYLLVDGYENDYEMAAVISNDSDLVEPIRMVRLRLGKDVAVLNPHSKPSVDMRQAAIYYRPIQERALKRSLFPDQIIDSEGSFNKPPVW